MKSTRRHLWVLFFIIFQTSELNGQNESNFKALITGKKSSKNEIPDDSKKIRTFSDFYRLDLNGNGHFEGIAVENSDQGSSIHFFKNHFEHFQELHVASGFTFSKIDRIEVKSISEGASALLIYFSEGLSKYLSSRSRHRLYVVYLPKELFKSPFQLNKGPIVFEEFQKRGHYHTRKYEVTVEDLNRDGISEIVIRHKKNELVMKLGKDNNFRLL